MSLKVKPCIGCGQLPHGGINAQVACLTAALIEARRERDELKRQKEQGNG